MPRAPASLDPAREAALLARARGSSAAEREAAFTELFELLREPSLALCLHLTGDRGDAEDALQDVFLAVHQGLPGFRGESRLYSWVYRIAIRLALRVRARRRARPAAALDVEPAAPRPAGGDPLERREEAARVQRALATLGADHRVVVSLFAIEGLSHREIAEILGIPEGTVWSRLHAARKRLAATLGPTGEGPG